MRSRLCSFPPAISMMKAAERGTGDHRRPRRRLTFHGTSMRRVLLEGIVNPVLVVVVHVLTNQPPEMFFMDRNDMVQDFPAADSHPSLGDAILPGRPNTRPLWLQARCFQETDHIGVEFRIAVQDQVAIGACL